MLLELEVEYRTRRLVGTEAPTVDQVVDDLDMCCCKSTQ